jgi:A nuclease family of the HNH/ENDO VII superfamily with conserved AHH
MSGQRHGEADRGRLLKLLVVTALLATVPVLRSSPALAGELSLSVDAWNRNLETGRVSYDFRVGGSGLAESMAPCDGLDCNWQVEAYYHHGTVSERIAQLASGSLSRDTSTFNESRNALDVSLREVTHLRGVLRPQSVYGDQGRATYTTWIEVAPAASGGAISLTVNEFQRDLATGTVSYDLRVDATEASRRGGPCYATDCRWKIEAWYRNVETNSLVSNLKVGAPPRGVWSFTNTVTGSGGLSEVTHLRASLYSYNYYSGTPPGDTYSTDFIPVAEASSGGEVILSVDSFERDPVSGTASFETTVEAFDMARRGGPCAGVDCRAVIEAWRVDGSEQFLIDRLKYFTPQRGSWYFSDSYSGSRYLGTATHLRVVVYSYTYYSGSPPGETDDSGLIPISDQMIGGYDLAYIAGFLKSNNVSLDELCLLVQDKTGFLNAEPDSPSTPAHACFGASTLIKALAAMALVMGGIGVAVVVHHYMSDDPGKGAIGHTEEPGPDPDPEPEPEAEGAGIQPPSNCITDPVARQELLYSLPRQDHHLATDKNRVAKPQWTEQFEELLWRYYPDRSLNEPWNIVEKMRHRGSHPFAYHQWVYSNLRRALSQSRGDWNQFLRRWNLWVRDVVVADATIARREYWSCFD